MKKTLLALSLLLGVQTLSTAQTTCPSWGPSASSYGLTNTGELLYTEVMAPATSIIPCIYWSSMIFYIGPRAGYCGIQNKPGNIKNNIFSVWDVQDSHAPQCFAEYTAPNTFVSGFAGEGTGLHTDNDINWTPGVWYATAVRRWYTGAVKPALVSLCMIIVRVNGSIT